MKLKQWGLVLVAGALVCGQAFAKEKEKDNEKSKGSDKSEHVGKGHDYEPKIPDVVFNTPAPVVSNPNSVISQVPEADAVAMAAVGAALVGAVAWRRRKAK